MPPSNISPAAQSGFTNSSAYDTHRPTYSPSIVEHLLTQLRVSGVKSAKILDLGAGTGKFTEVLVDREEEFEVVAVEPHADMRDVLVKKGLERVEVLDGMGEAMPRVGDESVDAVVVAQAFHWFSTLPALREIHRVLKPHGVLGLIWNIEDYNAPRTHQASTPWETIVHNLTWNVADESGDDAPRFRDLKWRKVFDEQIKRTPLSILVAGDGEQMFSLPVGEFEEGFEVGLREEGVWERFATLGHIAVLEGERLERTKKIFMDAISGEDVEKDENGNVIVHGKTYTVWTSKIPEEGRSSLVDVERADE